MHGLSLSQGIEEDFYEEDAYVKSEFEELSCQDMGDYAAFKILEQCKPSEARLQQCKPPEVTAGRSAVLSGIQVTWASRGPSSQKISTI